MSAVTLAAALSTGTALVCPVAAQTQPAAPVAAAPVAAAPVAAPASGAQASAGQAQPYFRGPYLGMASPTSMTIVWRTGGPIAPVVRIGNSPQRLTRSIAGPAIRTRVAGAGDSPLSVAPDSVRQYEATITGLKPNTRYYYGVYNGETLLAAGTPTYFFNTHPRVGDKRPFRFWVVGDSGTGGKAQKDVHTAMQRLVEAQKKPLDFYVHVGDMAYSNGTDDEFHRNFFAPYDETLRNTVCWPSMGNHEGHSSNGKTGVGPYYDAYVVPTRAEAGGVASGTEAYYSFDYGRTHFICLNSHDLDRRRTGAMAAWMKADLEATRADWIVAFWHHPPYTKGSHDSDKENQLIEMREEIMPMLESAGVDLVLTGHSHIYERSMLIDGAYATPTVAENVVLDDGDGDPAGDGAYRKSAGLHPNQGAVQIVAGHGGTGVRRVGTMPVMKRVFVEHGSVIVDVQGDTLTALMLNAAGRQRDLFSIVKRGKVTPQRIANPRQLPRVVDFSTVARLALQQPPAAGAATRAKVEFAPLPAGSITAGSTATIEWNTAGTAWEVLPRTATVPLSATTPTTTASPQGGLSAEQEFTLSHTGNIYPLPKAKIIYRVGQLDPNEKAFGNPGDREVAATLGVSLLPYRTATAAQMPAAPTVDGVLAPQELQGLTRQTDLINVRGTGTAKHPTEFYTGITGNQLYVAIVNHEPDMARLKIVEREFDGAIYSDDSNEVFIGRDGSPDYFQFIVNAAGQRYDGRRTDAKWNGQWSAATTRGTDRWTTEMLIPLDMLGAAVAPGETLRFNLVRSNVVQKEASQWSYTSGNGNHAPAFFGRLTVGAK